MSTEIESLLRQVNAKLDSTSADFSRQAEAALAEANNAGALSASTKAAVDQIATQHNGLKAASEKLAAQLGEVEQAIAAIPSAGGRGEPSPTAGQLVIAHEPMKAFASAMEGGRRISVPIPRAALLSTDLAPGVIEPQRIPGIDVSPKRRLFLRDLIASGATTSPAIWWVRMTGFTNAARVVREGQAKPYSGIEFTPEMTGVATIAHLFKMSKQIMDDMSQLMSTVDLEMKFGLDLAEEQELLFGDGTAGHLHGIVPQATPFQAAFDVEKQTGIDDMRLAMLQAQLARVPATGHVMHFVDWAKIELAKDTLGRYILANPAAVTGPTLWGLPVVPTEAPGFLGHFLTGSFEYGAQYFQREEANFVISTENADDFEKNMITGRCEKRGALAVRRPEAFIFGEFTPPVVTPPEGG